MNFKRPSNKINFAQFEKLVSGLTEFESMPNQKRYLVTAFDNGRLYFKRMDGNANKDWDFLIKDVYHAYEELADFKTASFKRFVPIRHSPARGLLYRLKMIEPI